MNKLSLIVSVSILLLATMSIAQNQPDPKAVKPSTAQAAPKATKRDAKTQCRNEGKAGKDLVDCIKEKSKGE